MSRNLGRIDCRECPGTHEDIVLEGPIRPVSEKEDAYFRAHEGLLIAEARCILCHTEVRFHTRRIEEEVRKLAGAEEAFVSWETA